LLVHGRRWVHAVNICTLARSKRLRWRKSMPEIVLMEFAPAGVEDHRRCRGDGEYATAA